MANMTNDDKQQGGRQGATLAVEPTDFFMGLRDLGFWVRGARADSVLAQFRSTATSGEAFDSLYRALRDPYSTAMPQFRYQRQKYRTMLSFLPKRTYRDVLDMGCGLGVLSRELASHAERVLGVDVSPHAVSQARALSTGLTNVNFEQGDIHRFDSARRFDLAVLADVVYYLPHLTDASFRQIAAKLAALLQPGGLLLLVNNFYFTIDPPSRLATRIHNVFRSAAEFAVVAEHRRPFYIATLLERQ